MTDTPAQARDPFAQIERAVPLVDRVRWLMLKALLDGDKSIQAISKTTGRSVRHWERVLFRHRDLFPSDVAMWFFACGLECRFDIRPLDEPNLAEQLRRRNGK